MFIWSFAQNCVTYCKQYANRRTYSLTYIKLPYDLIMITLDLM